MIYIAKYGGSILYFGGNFTGLGDALAPKASLEPTLLLFHENKLYLQVINFKNKMARNCYLCLCRKSNVLMIFLCYANQILTKNHFTDILTILRSIVNNAQS